MTMMMAAEAAGQIAQVGQYSSAVGRLASPLMPGAIAGEAGGFTRGDGAEVRHGGPLMWMLLAGPWGMVVLGNRCAYKR
jgi:hypothetical protein